MKKTAMVLALVSLVVVAHLALASSPKQQGAPAAGFNGVRAEMLVSTNWLADYLGHTHY